jgi:hypothetical protein
MVNTALTPLDPKECDDKPKAKMTKALQNAYKLASEHHDIDYYKQMLQQWQVEEKKIAEEQAEYEAQQQKELEERLAREAEEAKEAEDEEAKDKKKKKAPRKSKGGDEDVEMDGLEAPKSSKKRKKDAESDAEGTKVNTTFATGCYGCADLTSSQRRLRKLRSLTRQRRPMVTRLRRSPLLSQRSESARRRQTRLRKRRSRN